MKLKTILWWIVAPIALVLYVIGWLMPASYWYEPISIHISDAPRFQDPVVSISRTIKRDFHGRYSVSIWRDPPDGHVACAGSDTLQYRGGLYEPHESPLTQWVDDPWCARLPEGKYYAEACWSVIHPFWNIIPSKTTCAVSNIFAVKPMEDETNAQDQ